MEEIQQILDLVIVSKIMQSSDYWTEGELNVP